MQRPSCRVSLFALALAWPCLEHAHAADAEKPPATRWSGELGVGVEYDSNVAVEEVDRATNQSDYALTLDAGVGMQRDLSKTSELGLSYDFSQSIYETFSQVDRQTHILGTDLSFDFEHVDPGVSLYYIHSRLDGNKFLELYRASPSLSGFLSRKWYARGAYAYSDKSVENRPGRDAQTNALELDLYFFRRGLRSYFNLGYRYKDEDANADRYDYQSHSVKLRYIHRFELFSRLSKLELAWRYEDRNYSSETPSIGEDRDDQRNRWRIDYEIPLIGKTSVQFFAGYADYESNYPAAEYDQTLAGTRFLYSW
jgi:surface lipoprotein assembly modifier-like protein